MSRNSHVDMDHQKYTGDPELSFLLRSFQLVYVHLTDPIIHYSNQRAGLI